LSDAPVFQLKPSDEKMSADEAEPEELLTPEGNEADERCPICERPNAPGACDSCEHFFGCCWDGEIIWSSEFDDFEMIWSDLLSKIEEIGSDSPHKLRNARRRFKGTDAFSAAFQLAHEEASASEALMKLVDFQHGRTIETDGMLSGSGFSIYLADLAPFQELMETVVALENSLLE
jgi:hypothetical protein